MRRKINRYLVGMSVAVVIAVTLCLTFVFYGLFQRQVQKDLRLDAEVLQDIGAFPAGVSPDAGEGALSGKAEGGTPGEKTLRVTWIAENGTVLFDNDAQTGTLENHADRPEVQKALQSGEGTSVRRSATMGKNTFYYAVRLDDGSVLRLSQEVSSFFRVFASAIPVVLLIVALIILVCAVTARVLTGQLLAPIGKISRDMENTEDTPVYEELIPFVEKIREQHDNILTAAKVRQDFSANVSHELKTPLTAIAGYAELIENHLAGPEKDAAFAQQIKANADRLLSLIDDIIRLSELDNAETVVTFEQMDLYEAARECLRMLEVSAQKKNVKLTLAGGATPLCANPGMITELISNLCQNAIHYNKEGGQVLVSVSEEQGRPTLTVADTGIGIPKDMQDRVFERFFRVDKSRSKETGGTGLGLAIVKHIVELHDATITLESEEGAGTTVTVRF